MPDDSKKNIADFLDAAKRAATGVLTPEEQLREKEGASIRTAQQAFYDQVIKPFADALSALPEKDGKKFSCSATQKDRGGTPVLRIVLLHQVTHDSNPRFSPTTKKLSISLYGFENNQAPVCLSYANAENTAATTNMSPKLASEIPDTLGKWVASVAPECLNDLAESLRDPAKKSAPEKQRIRVLKPLKFNKHG